MKVRMPIFVFINLLSLCILGSAMGQGFKIGAVLPMTGPQAFIGTAEKNAAQMATDEINRSGGIRGQKLEFIAYDDTGDPSKAVLAVKKLIEVDKVPVIVGPGTTPCTMAVIPIVEKAQIPLISAAYSTAVTHPVKKWVFKVGGDSLLEVRVYANEYLIPMGIKKVATLYVSTSYGEDGRDSIRKVMPENSIEIVREESYNQNDVDMTPQLTRIKASDAQVLIVWGTNPGPAIIAKNRKQIGLKIPVLNVSGIIGSTYLELAGDAANGILSGGQKLVVAQLLPDTHPDKKGLLKFIDEYNQKYGKEVALHVMVGYGYEALMLAAEALKKAGPDRAKIRDTIENTKNFVGISGTYSYSPTDHSGLSTKEYLFMIEIVNNKIERWKGK